MTVEVLCPHCGAAYQIAPEKMGKSARCKKCSQNFALESRAGQTSHSQAALETGRGGDSSTNKQPLRKLGRFEIREKLGSGAFGTVYRAFDPLLEREVALKVPNPAALETEADKARYLREPKAAAQLRHPNIVPIFDAGVDNGQYYIASAFIDGKTLQCRLEEQRPDLREAAQLVMKLASALHYAHEQGIVHRDVKPANIMLDAKGEPHLMDFGLAQIRAAEDRLTHDGTVLGTPAYMSPEQARGQASEVGPASDQYSLGVVLYELLCGERPFHGPPALVISLVQSQEPESPRKHISAIPRDLETICLKAMAKEPDRRYPTCDALQDDLRSWLAGAPVRARPLSVTERTTRWCRRNPAIAASLATVALLLSTVFAVVFAAFLQTSAAYRSEAAAVQREAAERVKAEDERQRAVAARVEATNSERKANKESELAQAESRRAYQQHYLGQMLLASRDWQNNSVTSFAHRLEVTQPRHTGGTDFRDFEWHYFTRNQSFGHKAVKLADAHPRAMRLGPGPNEASLLYDDCVKVLDTTTGRLLSTHAVEFTSKGMPHSPGSNIQFRGVRAGHMGQFAFSTDGRKVAIAVHDWQILVWNRDTPKQTIVLAGHGKSNLEKMIGGPGNSTPSNVSVLSVAFSRDGNQLASWGSDGTARVWSLASGTETCRISPERWSPSFSGMSLGFSASNQHLAVPTLGGYRVCSIAERKELAAFPLQFATLSNDGTKVAGITRDNHLEVHDVKSGSAKWKSLEKIDKAHGAPLAFSPDGTTLWSSDSSAVLRAWSVESGELKATRIGNRTPTRDIIFHDHGKSFATVDDQYLRLWSGDFSQSDATISRSAKGAVSLCFLGKSRQLAAFDSASVVERWNLDDPQKIASVGEKIHVPKREQGSTSLYVAATCSANGKTMALARDDGYVFVLDMETGRCRTVSTGRSFHAPCCIAPTGDAVAISTDRGAEIVAAHDDGAVPSLPWDEGRCAAVAYSSDGTKLAAIRDGGGISLRSQPDWKESANIAIAPGEFLGKTKFNPAGTLVAAVSGERLNNITIWNCETRELRCVLRGHSRQIRDFDFNPTGSRVATAGADKIVRLWEIETGQEVASFTEHADEVSAVAFSPDGNLLVSASVDGVMKVRDGTPRTTSGTDFAESAPLRSPRPWR